MKFIDCLHSKIIESKSNAIAAVIALIAEGPEFTALKKNNAVIHIN